MTMQDNIIPLPNIIESDPSSWEKDLNTFSHSLFITPEWTLSMGGLQNIPLFLDFIDDGQIVAKASGLICTESKLMGSVLFCYAYPALKTEDQRLLNRCLDALAIYAKSKKISRIIIGSYDQQNSLKCNCLFFFPNKRYEYIVFSNEEDGKHHFIKGFRKNVKRAESKNANLINDNSGYYFESLIKLLKKTRKHRLLKYGTRYNPYYLKHMNERSLTKVLSSGLGQIYSVLYNGEKNLCIQFNIEKNNRLYGLLMGSDKMAYEFGFPSFVDYNLVMMIREKGYKYYNSGGTPNDKGKMGIERYKLAMGSTKVEVYGATTNFLTFPRKILNPFLTLGRLLPRNNIILKLMKEFIN